MLVPTNLTAQAPAFTKLRDQDRCFHGQASIQGRQADANTAPPLFTPSDQTQSFQLGGARSGDAVGGGLLLARPASPPPPPEANSEAIVVSSLPPSSEARPGEALEAERRDEEEGATAVIPATAVSFVVQEGRAGGARMRKDGAVSEETATKRSDEVGRRPPTTSGAGSAPIGSAVAGANSLRIGAGGEDASRAGIGFADDGRGVGPAGVASSSTVSSPCHGGNTTGRGDREVSLTELEKGQAKPAKAGIVAGAAEEDAVDGIEAVADGGLAVGHGERGVAAPAGGVDIEGGRSGVDANVEVGVAIQA